jgi:hypothetical protein
MADPLLVPFFEGVDMKKQAKKQVGGQVQAGARASATAAVQLQHGMMVAGH